MNDSLLNRLRAALAARDGVLGKDKYFNAAVLIPIIKINSEYNLLFEKRAKHIRQGGEVSFPGGEFDKKKDNDFLDTALRETFEEIGIPRSEIEIIGTMDTLIAPMGISIEPWLRMLAS